MLLPNISEGDRREALQKTGSIKRLKEADLDYLKTIFDTEFAKKIYLVKNKLKESKTKYFKQIIQISFNAQNGNAEDLQPINYK
jgi:ERCC4-type nuclease